jgi:hypothetical protein
MMVKCSLNKHKASVPLAQYSAYNSLSDIDMFGMRY